jgi:hypothetical protein
LAVLAISTLVGGVCAKLNTSGNMQVAGASTHVLIDDPGPSIIERRALPQNVSTLQEHAELYGRLLTTTPVLQNVARHAGVPASELSGLARITIPVPVTLTQPDSELRASQIVDSRAQYRLEMQASPGEPILTIYSQAPSPQAAVRLANAAVLGLQDYLRALAHQQGFAESKLPVLRALGAPRGGVISGHAPIVIGALTFVTAFALTCAFLFGLVYLRARRTTVGSDDDAPADDEEGLDNWPHTTRALPWMVAVFITMLWLTPFDKVELGIHTPIDLKLDRMVLPFLLGVWVLAFVARGKLRPRLRLTPIHLAVAAFVACAFLSVVFDARYLNQTLELDLALKKLPLLVSYISLFVIVASSVRRTEVRAFMTYSLVLAVIVAIGIIWEYRFSTNPFNNWTARLLPPGFKFDGTTGTESGVDSLGRRGIVGPAQVGLEAVSMLAMALPIAVVGVLGTKKRRERILYALAICLLVAATFGTVRKSAMLAPISVFATLAYFRRRELLSLAPLGLVVAVVVAMLSPGAVHNTIAQFVTPDSANAATTQDRVSDYDAVRPDVWTHLLFGRGFGSYNHDTYRILDSEILGRTVETGVLGVLAFVLISVAVVFTARRTIASRVSPYAGLALIGTAAAVCFLTVSTLFDVLGFPHITYIFLCLAGFVAAVADPPTARHAPPTRRDHAYRRHWARQKSRTLGGVH